MAEYIDRAQALSELRNGWFPQSMEYTEAVAIAKSIIEGLPAVDAVEVVRCADCGYYDRDKGVCRGRPTEPMLHRRPDYFCFYGVRREERKMNVEQQLTELHDNLREILDPDDCGWISRATEVVIDDLIMGGVVMVDAEWVVSENGCVITCSSCGERLELCYPDGTEVRCLPRCPWCGAKMDRDRSEK